MNEYSQYYERLIKSAFIFKMGIYEDPAQLADVRCFTEENIDSVKCVVGYSITILNNGIISNHNISEEKIKKLESYVNKVVSAKDLQELGKLIEKYITKEKIKYYNRLGNIIISKGKVT